MQWRNHSIFGVPKGANPKPFELLGIDQRSAQYEDIQYEKDDEHVFYEGNLISGTDNQTFTSSLSGQDLCRLSPGDSEG